MKKEPAPRSESLLITTDKLGRLSSFKSLVKHKMYLGHMEPDGTIVLIPATIMPIKAPLRIELPEDS